MKLASIELIKEISPHSNADSLEIATVLGYQCIVGKGSFKAGDTVVLIQPDTVLPDAKWAAPFKAKNSRVRAVKLRGVWSFGIAMSPYEITDENTLLTKWLLPENIGNDISEDIGVIKYEAPAPQCFDASGYLPTGMPKTDEERFQNFGDELPFGEPVDVTLKIDGQSVTFFCIKKDDEWETGTCSRSLRMKPESNNNYTKVDAMYKILEKLRNYCSFNNVSLALRGEVFGQGVQAFPKNPHATGPLDFRAFSVFNMDTREYEGPNDPHYYTKLCSAFVIGIPCVPMIEQQIILTPELIRKYSEELTELNGRLFEGVVIKHNKGSFKVINLHYDSK